MEVSATSQEEVIRFVDAEAELTKMVKTMLTLTIIGIGVGTGVGILEALKEA